MLTSPAPPSFSDRQAFRRSRRAARRKFFDSLPTDTRTQLEEQLAEVVIPHLGPPGVLGVHAAIGAEISPDAVMRRAARLGWRIAWPRAQPDAPLMFHIAPKSTLSPGYQGIPEPPATTPQVHPDVLLVPLVAVDPRGNRLGQGGGHYDRTLAEARSHGPVMAVGLCWDMQIVDSLDMQPWDQPLDAIATPAVFRPVFRHAR